MKVNQIGTLAIVGVVVSLMAACGGSPTKPTADLTFGTAASAAPASVSSANLLGAVAQICSGQSETVQDGTDQANEGTTAGAPSVTCDSSAAAAPEESDLGPIDSARYAKRLRR